MSQTQRPMPVATDVTRPFWEAAAAHRLVVQQCQACGQRQFYPRAFCRHCLADDLAWQACCGLGRIYTFTINHRAANAHMADQLPYAVAIVALDEGVRMMTNLVDSPLDRVQIGARVAVRWLDTPGQPTLPQFQVVAE